MAYNNHPGAYNSAPYPDERFAPPPPPKSGPYDSSSRSSPSPPYSQTPLAAPPYSQPARNGASPFDSVFDDPRDRRQYPGAGAAQPGYGQDTGYYGQGGAASNSRPYASENIPLQDQTGKNHEINDHVYDAPSAAENGRRRPKTKGKVRLGELGMFGANKKRIPFITYFFTTVQVVVFIAEIIRNGVLTGSPIQVKPSFNPMIGPSGEVLINMGARFVPCMHNVKEIQGSTVPFTFPCPNTTTADTSGSQCSLSELCGLGGVPNPTFNNANQSPAPNQWYRFITPIFMHAGLIHIGFNLLMQLTIAKEMEMAIGPIRFFLVYMSAGIFGFVLGGNFAAPFLPSTGASGALFGIIALTLLDLLYSWKERKNPIKDLMFLFLDMLISFALGLLPGLDNFAHIGGFLMGLGLGICVLHSPNALRKRMGGDTPYSVVVPGEDGSPSGKLFNGPMGFFKGRKPLWWLWWIIRAAVLVAVIVVFIVLLNNFYTSQKTCGWCKYLSCIPVNNWCEDGNIKLITSNS